MHGPLTAAIVAAAGCSSSDGAPDAQAVVVVAADDPDISFVAVTSPNDATWICSGSVIAPRVVLTARHCVDGGNYDKTGWTFDVFFGVDRDHRKDTDRVVHVKEFHYPQVDGAGVVEGISPSDAAGGSDNADGDVAVLILASPVTAAPVSWNDQPLTKAIVGQPIRFVGYGRDKPNDDPTGRNGVRDPNDTVVSDVTPGAVALPAGKANPCHGDSGGPMLLKRDGVEVVIGVGHEALSEDCVSGADYERTDRYATFLRRYIDANR